MILEVFAPGAFILWLGIAPAAVGGLVCARCRRWAGNTSSSCSPCFGRSVFSIWRRLPSARSRSDTDQPTLNRRGEQYIGRTFTLDEPIINGLGKIRVDDSTWKIEGEDCASGTRIKVVGAEGTLLRVAPWQ